MKLHVAVSLLVGLLPGWIIAAAPLAPVFPEKPSLSGQSANPYAIISERNLFQLNPEPLPEPAPEAPKPEIPEVKLSGFYREGPITKALFCATSKEKKDVPMYFSLSEGQKADFLEVVRIQFEKGAVEIVNSGNLMTLTLKDDSLGIKPPPGKGNEPGGLGRDPRGLNRMAFNPNRERFQREQGQQFGGPPRFSSGPRSQHPGFPMLPSRRTAGQ